MKKTLLTILICSLCSVYVQAQCFDFYVKTPNNGNIKACTGGGYSPSQVQSADAYSRTFAISSSHVYEAGTNSYNCHGYAWHVKEGGNKVWINNVGYEYNNLSGYWNDDSYYVYDYNNQPHVENLKVVYGNDDHTAVTTSDPNVFISKMGCGALVAHHKDQSPYTEGNFTYYIKAPIISGPYLVCTSGATFTVTNWQQGYTWSSSSNISISGSGSSIRASQQGVGEDFGWISIRNNGVELVRKEVWVGPPFADYILGDNYPYESKICYRAIYNQPISIPTQWLWRIDGYFYGNKYTFPGGYGSLQPTPDEICFQFTGVSSFYLYVAGKNACGTGTEQYLQIYAVPTYFYSIAYPNPASNILNINIDAQVKAITNTKQLKSDPTYDVRLYDNQGNLLRQQKAKGGTVQFNVAGLPNGVYYLHIYDGVSEKPEMRQIIVEH